MADITIHVLKPSVNNLTARIFVRHFIPEIIIRKPWKFCHQGRGGNWYLPLSPRRVCPFYHTGDR